MISAIGADRLHVTNACCARETSPSVLNTMLSDVGNHQKWLEALGMLASRTWKLM
jgi:hypothetical protein